MRARGLTAVLQISEQRRELTQMEEADLGGESKASLGLPTGKLPPTLITDERNHIVPETAAPRPSFTSSTTPAVPQPGASALQDQHALIQQLQHRVSHLEGLSRTLKQVEPPMRRGLMGQLQERDEARAELQRCQQQEAAASVYSEVSGRCKCWCNSLSV